MHDGLKDVQGHSHSGVQEQPENSPACGEDLFGEPVMDQLSVTGRPKPQSRSRRPWKPADYSLVTVRLSNRAVNALEVWLAEQPHQPRSASEGVNMALETLVFFDAAHLDAAAVKLDRELEDLRARLQGVKHSIATLQANTENSGASQ